MDLPLPLPSSNWSSNRSTSNRSIPIPTRNPISIPVTKSRIVYNTMISALGKGGEWKQAMELYMQMGALADRGSRQTVVAALGK